jgi:hypothetical protein
VLPDLRRVVDHVDAVFGELLAISDAGQQQQLRAVDCTTAQHHLAACPDHPPLTTVLEFNTDGACPIEQHPRRGGFRVQREVAAPQCRVEIGVGATPPGSSALSDYRIAKAFWLRLVRLLDPVPALLRCFEPGSGRGARAALG